MQVPTKRRKKRGKLYFSSSKALKTSRMGRKKVATERFETTGINNVLDFEDNGDNATLSMVEEYEGSLHGRESQIQEPSKNMGTQSIDASNPASQEESGEEEVEETRLMDSEGGLSKP